MLGADATNNERSTGREILLQRRFDLVRVARYVFVIQKLWLRGLSPPPKPQLEERNHIARPQLSPAEKRSETLQIMVSPVERAKIEAKADQARLPMADYLRGVALKPKLKIIQGRQLDFEATDQLRRVGVLLNQIAKAMNAKQEALPSSLVDATEKLDAIFDVILADVSEDW